MERLSGAPREELVEPEPRLDVSTEPEGEEEEEGDVAPDPVIAPSQDLKSDLEPATVEEADPDPIVDPEPIAEQWDHKPKPVPMQKQETLLRRESSLGGSARELLNPDGRLKQP